MKSMYKVILPLLVLALLTNGCVLTPVAIDAVLGMIPTPQVQESVPAATREPTPMEETTWVLQSLNGVPPFSDVEITMEFRISTSERGDTLGGHAVCNGYGVPYQIDGHRLTVVGNEFISSAADCSPESHSNLEMQYYRILASVEFYKLEGDTLTLSTEQGDTLVFTAQVQ
jgi:heat shock protein HslJ